MIYLDHAAATPVSKKVLRAMEPFMTEDFFNPSAAYLPAKRVREAYEKAKDQIANYVGAKGDDIVITSGATEANMLAFTCVSKTSKTLVLETEHASVLENAKKYKSDKIKVDRDGLINLNDLRNKLTDDVELVSISLANNEIGTIQPLSEISAIIRRVRLERLRRGIPTQLILHSDASQGLALMDLNVSRLGVDLMTLNSAKVCGPKGVGALYVGHGIRLRPVTFGGGQERGIRAGTENVAGVIGFATALESINGHSVATRKKYARLTKMLEAELKKAKVEPVFLGSSKHRLASFLPVSFPGLDAERLIFKLEEREIYVSTGAACSASKGEPSHVLRAIGLSDEEIAGSLRLSVGVTNTEEDIKEAGKEIVEVVNHEFERVNNA